MLRGDGAFPARRPARDLASGLTPCSTSLRRHDLVRLAPEAWHDAQAAATGAEADVLALWRERDLPVVVARQDGAAPGCLRLGLPAPVRFDRRRLTLAVAADGLLDARDFPRAGEIAPLIAAPARPAWDDLARALPGARVFGSHGWQHLTGLAYLRPGSDIDLLVPVDDPAAADAVAARLDAAPAALPRLDGELLFPGGAAVAWREWQAWRAGAVRELLVKRTRGVALAATLAELAP